MPIVRESDRVGTVISLVVSLACFLAVGSYCNYQKNACDKKGGELVRSWNGTYQCAKVIK